MAVAGIAALAIVRADDQRIADNHAAGPVAAAGNGLAPHQAAVLNVHADDVGVLRLTVPEAGVDLAVGIGDRRKGLASQRIFEDPHGFQGIHIERFEHAAAQRADDQALRVDRGRVAVAGGSAHGAGLQDLAGLQVQLVKHRAAHDDQGVIRDDLHAGSRGPAGAQLGRPLQHGGIGGGGGRRVGDGHVVVIAAEIGPVGLLRHDHGADRRDQGCVAGCRLGRHVIGARFREGDGHRAVGAGGEGAVLQRGVHAGVQIVHTHDGVLHRRLDQVPGGIIAPAVQRQGDGSAQRAVFRRIGEEAVAVAPCGGVGIDVRGDLIAVGKVLLGHHIGNGIVAVEAGGVGRYAPQLADPAAGGVVAVRRIVGLVGSLQRLIQGKLAVAVQVGHGHRHLVHRHAGIGHGKFTGVEHGDIGRNGFRGVVRRQYAGGEDAQQHHDHQHNCQQPCGNVCFLHKKLRSFLLIRFCLQVSAFPWEASAAPPPAPLATARDRP